MYCILVISAVISLYLGEWLMNEGSALVLSLHAVTFSGILSLLIFQSKVRLTVRVILFSIFLTATSFSSLYSFGLLSLDKTYLLTAPVILSFAVGRRWSYAFIMVIVCGFLFIGDRFSTGQLPLPDLSTLNHFLHLPIDAAAITVVSFAMVIIISGMREKLIANVSDIYERYSRLKMEEETLKAIRIDLNEKVQNRVTDLNDSQAMLLEARKKLQEQHDMFVDQQKVLEKTNLDIRAAQADLSQARKLASLGSLSLGVAHEINNPLNFIQGTLVVLEKRLAGSGDQPSLDLLASIQAGAGQVNRIVKGLAQFGSHNEETVELCDVLPILEGCRLMVSPKLGPSTRLEIVQPGSPCMVTANRGKLHQLFINIFYNAVQAVSDEGLILVSVFQKQASNMVVVRVSDNGIGIPEEILHRITEPFFTTRPAGKGTGLGLYICRQIVDELHGSLTFRSRSGKGTDVDIELPG